MYSSAGIKEEEWILQVLISLLPSEWLDTQNKNCGFSYELLYLLTEFCNDFMSSHQSLSFFDEDETEMQVYPERKHSGFLLTKI